jgi:hypothetical protein
MRRWKVEVDNWADLLSTTTCSVPISVLNTTPSKTTGQLFIFIGIFTFQSSYPHEIEFRIREKNNKKKPLQHPWMYGGYHTLAE